MSISAHRLVRSLIAAAGLAALAPSAHAQVLSSAFTYQGRLTDAGNTATGAYDFQFKLFDAAAGGTQQGATVVVNDLAVAAGLFTARVDFGDQFTGDPRWLQIETRPGASTGAYTILNPRQELTGTPYALGPWQIQTGGVYPNNGYFLRAGNAYVSVDSLNGDMHVNGGADGHFGIYNDGVNSGRTELISARGVNLAVVNQTGNVGINTTNPAFRLHVNGTPADQFTFVVQNHSSVGGNAIRGVIEADGSGNFSAGVTGVNLAPAGPSGGFGMYAEHANGGTGIRAIGHGNGNGVEGLAQGSNAWGGYFKNTAGGVALFADGLTMVRTLQILGGADLAEPFNIHSAAADTIEPGMVVIIDPANPGELRLADQPYDTKVAGVISGANGLSPGMVMKAEDSEHADGKHPVAMTGRVWCYVDASFGAITPGARLTTSPTPGHAMLASDAANAGGAVIGKAMTELKEGKGLVMVLVNLQ